MLNETILNSLVEEIHELKPTERDLGMLDAIADGWATFAEDSVAGRPINHMREAALKAAVSQLSSAIQTRVTEASDRVLRNSILMAADLAGDALKAALV